MGHILAGIWNRFEGACILEGDSPELRRRKVTLVIIAVLSCLLAILSGANSYAVSGVGRDLAIPFSYAIVVGLAILIFFLAKRFAVLLYPFLVMILLTPAIFQWVVGGFSPAGTVSVIFYSLLAPFGALMFLTVRKALWWFAAYLVLVVASLCLDEYFTQFALPASHDELMVAQGISIIGFSAVIFITVLYFVNAFQKEHDKVEGLVVDLTDANGELASALGELRETQAELVQSEKAAALGKLAAGVAHEINNPVGALKSAADTCNRGVSRIEQLLETTEGPGGSATNPDLRNLLQVLKDNSQVVSSAADRITGTVSSFMSFSRLDGAEFARVDIHIGIDSALSLIQREIGDGVTVVKAYGDIPSIACYPGELNQVFLNLLTNAAQAIVGEGRITVRTFLEGGEVHVQVTDTGVGIPRERMEGLFDPGFARTGTRVKAGMGLYTSYSIVQKHRGEIRVQSEVGVGSTFTVILPTDLEEPGVCI